MAQWDVYANPSARSRAEIPYFVSLQSDLLVGLNSRWVAPLSLSRIAADGLPRRLCPTFTIEGQLLALLPQQASAIDARLLKRKVATLRAHAQEIVGALDAVVSGL